uniref:C-SKI SMAD4-binding domain-containing protein n=1 Tax=Ditylenchus dipsaci TaxID=166011 RepID=A0A915E7J7_9BILA
MSLTNGVHLLAPEDRQHLQPQYSTSSSLSPSQSENSSSDQLMENLQRLFDSQKKSGKEESSESDTEEMPSTSVIKPDENNKTTIPFMLQPDTKFSSLKSTRILDQLISCFVVGGECRLCFPQLAALVLGEVPQRYIDEKLSDLHIVNIMASKEQLQVLKFSGIIPTTAAKCDLITKSNAERLIASCLSTGTAAPILDETKEDMESIQIAHDCFGGCSGRLFNALSPGPCIECSDCKNLFIPESFCRHSHSETAKKLMCHWGFDSSNWPYYLHLDNSLEVRNNAEENFLNFVQNYRQHLANVSN